MAPYTILENQVFREIDKLKEHFTSAPPSLRLGEKGYKAWSKERTTMLRLDTEVADRLPYVERVDLALRHIEHDLVYMVFDGDVNNRRDALLKSFDGFQALENKGKEMTNFTISSASLYEELKPKKNLYYYTLYAVVYIETQDIQQ